MRAEDRPLATARLSTIRFLLRFGKVSVWVSGTLETPKSRQKTNYAKPGSSKSSMLSYASFTPNA